MSFLIADPTGASEGSLDLGVRAFRLVVTVGYASVILRLVISLMKNAPDLPTVVALAGHFLRLRTFASEMPPLSTAASC